MCSMPMRVWPKRKASSRLNPMTSLTRGENLASMGSWIVLLALRMNVLTRPFGASYAGGPGASYPARLRERH
jgi:hypothetical protein